MDPFLLLYPLCLLVKPGESLKDFYERTNMYWQMAAHEHTQHTGKVGFPFKNLVQFILCCDRYKYSILYLV